MLLAMNAHDLLARRLGVLAACLTLAVAAGCNEELIDPSDTRLPDADAVGDGIGPDPDACPVEVTWDGAAAAASVHIGGSFNGWSATATPMLREAGLWRAELALPPGSYAYKHVVNGTFEQAPPPSVYTQWDGGVENRRLLVPDCHAPRLEVLDAAIDAAGTLRATARFTPASDGAAIDPSSLTVTAGRAPVAATLAADGVTIEVEHALTARGKHSLRVDARDTAGRDLAGGAAFVPLWWEEVAFEWRDAIIYLVFVDRFRDTDGGPAPIDDVPARSNFQGGDLRGVIESLDAGYFDALGVNTLWLSPLYDNPEAGYPDRAGDILFSGYHGYWPVAAREVEGRLGDAQASGAERLRELIDKAHARGMRVLFDAVLNHVHEDHHYCEERPEWCVETCVCGRDPGCGWDERPLDCQFVPYLPDLDYRNPAIVERVIEDTLWWAVEYDFDGFRVDAAKHMDHVIMRTLSLTLKDRFEAPGGAPFYLLGETFTGGDGYDDIMRYVAPWELDGQFDFPLFWTLQGTFAHHGASFRALEDAIARSESRYGDAIWAMSPFAGNHDVPRFATEIVGNDGGPWGETPDLMALGSEGVIDAWDVINRMSMAMAVLYGLKGAPLLYYGDEIGLAGAGDPDNRRMMMFEPALNANQRELLRRVEELGQARRALAPLRRGDRRELWIDDDLYVFARWTAEEAVILAMNKGAPRTVEVTAPAELGLEGKTLSSWASSREITVSGGTFSLSLEPWEYAIFRVP